MSRRGCIMRNTTHQPLLTLESFLLAVVLTGLSMPLLRPLR
jgi:hypothetical protein